MGLFFIIKNGGRLVAGNFGCSVLNLELIPQMARVCSGSVFPLLFRTSLQCASAGRRDMVIAIGRARRPLHR